MKNITIDIRTASLFGPSCKFVELLQSYHDKKGFILSDFVSGYREPSGIMTEFDALFLNKSFFKELNGQN
tara:strand:+ start:1294 stop:1503 length:210 start_codon:yes stop_codon:yes gene_type:complete